MSLYLVDSENDRQFFLPAACKGSTRKKAEEKTKKKKTTTKKDVKAAQVRHVKRWLANDRLVGMLSDDKLRAMREFVGSSPELAQGPGPDRGSTKTPNIPTEAVASMMSNLSLKDSIALAEAFGMTIEETLVAHPEYASLDVWEELVTRAVYKDKDSMAARLVRLRTQEYPDDPELFTRILIDVFKRVYKHNVPETLLVVLNSLWAYMRRNIIGRPEVFMKYRTGRDSTIPFEEFQKRLERRWFDISSVIHNMVVYDTMEMIPIVLDHPLPQWVNLGEVGHSSEKSRETRFAISRSLYHSIIYNDSLDVDSIPDDHPLIENLFTVLDHPVFGPERSDFREYLLGVELEEFKSDIRRVVPTQRRKTVVRLFAEYFGYASSSDLLRTIGYDDDDDDDDDVYYSADESDDDDDDDDVYYSADEEEESGRLRSSQVTHAHRRHVKGWLANDRLVSMLTQEQHQKMRDFVDGHASVSTPSQGHEQDRNNNNSSGGGEPTPPRSARTFGHKALVARMMSELPLDEAIDLAGTFGLTAEQTLVAHPYFFKPEILGQVLMRVVRSGDLKREKFAVDIIAAYRKEHKIVPPDVTSAGSDEPDNPPFMFWNGVRDLVKLAMRNNFAALTKTLLDEAWSYMRAFRVDGEWLPAAQKWRTSVDWTFNLRSDTGLDVFKVWLDHPLMQAVELEDKGRLDANNPREGDAQINIWNMKVSDFRDLRKIDLFLNHPVFGPPKHRMWERIQMVFNDIVDTAQTVRTARRIDYFMHYYGISKEEGELAKALPKPGELLLESMSKRNLYIMRYLLFLGLRLPHDIPDWNIRNAKEWSVEFVEFFLTDPRIRMSDASWKKLRLNLLNTDHEALIPLILTKPTPIVEYLRTDDQFLRKFIGEKVFYGKFKIDTMLVDQLLQLKDKARLFRVFKEAFINDIHRGIFFDLTRITENELLLYWAQKDHQFAIFYFDLIDEQIRRPVGGPDATKEDLKLAYDDFRQEHKVFIAGRDKILKDIDPRTLARVGRSSSSSSSNNNSSSSSQMYEEEEEEEEEEGGIASRVGNRKKRFKQTQATHAHRRHVEGWLANEKLVATLSQEQVQDMHDFVQHVNQTQAPEPNRSSRDGDGDGDGSQPRSPAAEKTFRQQEAVAAMMGQLSLEEAVELASSFGFTVKQTIVAHPEYFESDVVQTVMARALRSANPETQRLATELLKKYMKTPKYKPLGLIHKGSGVISDVVQKNQVELFKLLLDDAEREAASRTVRGKDGWLRPPSTLMDKVVKDMSIDGLQTLLDHPYVQKKWLGEKDAEARVSGERQMTIWTDVVSKWTKLPAIKLYMRHPEFGPNPEHLKARMVQHLGRIVTNPHGGSVKRVQLLEYFIGYYGIGGPDMTKRVPEFSQWLANRIAEGDLYTVRYLLDSGVRLGGQDIPSMDLKKWGVDMVRLMVTDPRVRLANDVKQQRLAISMMRVKSPEGAVLALTTPDSIANALLTDDQFLRNVLRRLVVSNSVNIYYSSDQIPRNIAVVDHLRTLPNQERMRRVFMEALNLYLDSADWDKLENIAEAQALLHWADMDAAFARDFYNVLIPRVQQVINSIKIEYDDDEIDDAVAPWKDIMGSLRTRLLEVNVARSIAITNANDDMNQEEEEEEEEEGDRTKRIRMAQATHAHRRHVEGWLANEKLVTMLSQEQVQDMHDFVQHVNQTQGPGADRGEMITRQPEAVAAMMSNLSLDEAVKLASIFGLTVEQTLVAHPEYFKAEVLVEVMIRALKSQKVEKQDLAVKILKEYMRDHPNDPYGFMVKHFWIFPVAIRAGRVDFLRLLLDDFGEYATSNPEDERVHLPRYERIIPYSLGSITIFRMVLDHWVVQALYLGPKGSPERTSGQAQLEVLNDYSLISAPVYNIRAYLQHPEFGPKKDDMLAMMTDIFETLADRVDDSTSTYAIRNMEFFIDYFELGDTFSLRVPELVEYLKKAVHSGDLAMMKYYLSKGFVMPDISARNIRVKYYPYEAAEFLMTDPRINFSVDLRKDMVFRFLNSYNSAVVKLVLTTPSVIWDILQTDDAFLLRVVTYMFTQHTEEITFLPSFDAALAQLRKLDDQARLHRIFFAALDQVPDRHNISFLIVLNILPSMKQWYRDDPVFMKKMTEWMLRTYRPTFDNPKDVSDDEKSFIKKLKARLRSTNIVDENTIEIINLIDEEEEQEGEGEEEEEEEEGDRTKRIKMTQATHAHRRHVEGWLANEKLVATLSQEQVQDMHAFIQHVNRTQAPEPERLASQARHPEAVAKMMGRLSLKEAIDLANTFGLTVEQTIVAHPEYFKAEVLSKVILRALETSGPGNKRAAARTILERYTKEHDPHGALDILRFNPLILKRAIDAREYEFLRLLLKDDPTYDVDVDKQKGLASAISLKDVRVPLRDTFDRHSLSLLDDTLDKELIEVLFGSRLFERVFYDWRTWKRGRSTDYIASRNFAWEVDPLFKIGIVYKLMNRVGSVEALEELLEYEEFNVFKEGEIAEQYPNLSAQQSQWLQHVAQYTLRGLIAELLDFFDSDYEEFGTGGGRRAEKFRTNIKKVFVLIKHFGLRSDQIMGRQPYRPIIDGLNDPNSPLRVWGRRLFNQDWTFVHNNEHYLSELSEPPILLNKLLYYAIRANDLTVIRMFIDANLDISNAKWVYEQYAAIKMTPEMFTFVFTDIHVALSQDDMKILIAGAANAPTPENFRFAVSQPTTWQLMILDEDLALFVIKPILLKSLENYADFMELFLGNVPENMPTLKPRIKATFVAALDHLMDDLVPSRRPREFPNLEAWDLTFNIFYAPTFRRWFFEDIVWAKEIYEVLTAQKDNPRDVTGMSGVEIMHVLMSPNRTLQRDIDANNPVGSSSSTQVVSPVDENTRQIINLVDEEEEQEQEEDEEEEEEGDRTKRIRMTKATHAHRRHVEGWLANEKLVATLSREQVQDMHDFIQHVNQTQGPEPDRGETITRQPEAVAAMMSNLSLDEAVKLASTFGLTVEQTLVAHPEYFKAKVLAEVMVRALKSRQVEKQDLAVKILKEYMQAHPNDPYGFMVKEEELTRTAVKSGRVDFLRLLLDELGEYAKGELEEDHGLIALETNIFTIAASDPVMFQAMLDHPVAQNMLLGKKGSRERKSGQKQWLHWTRNDMLKRPLPIIRAYLLHPEFGPKKDDMLAMMTDIFKSLASIADHRFAEHAIPKMDFFIDYFELGDEFPFRVHELGDYLRSAVELGYLTQMKYYLSKGFIMPDVNPMDFSVLNYSYEATEFLLTDPRINFGIDMRKEMVLRFLDSFRPAVVELVLTTPSFIWDILQTDDAYLLRVATYMVTTDLRRMSIVRGFDAALTQLRKLDDQVRFRRIFFAALDQTPGRHDVSFSRILDGLPSIKQWYRDDPVFLKKMIEWLIQNYSTGPSGEPRFVVLDQEKRYIDKLKARLRSIDVNENSIQVINLIDDDEGDDESGIQVINLIDEDDDEEEGDRTKRIKMSQVSHAHRQHVEGWLANEKLVDTLSKRQLLEMRSFVQHVNQTQGPGPDRAALARNPEVVASMMSNLHLDDAIELANTFGLTIEQTIIAHPEYFEPEILGIVALKALRNNRAGFAYRMMRNYIRMKPDESAMFVRAEPMLLKEAIDQGRVDMVGLLLDDLDKELSDGGQMSVESEDQLSTTEFVLRMYPDMLAAALRTGNAALLQAMLDSRAYQQALLGSEDEPGRQNRMLQTTTLLRYIEFMRNTIQLRAWMEHPVFAPAKDVGPVLLRSLFVNALDTKGSASDIVAMMKYLKTFYFGNTSRRLAELVPTIATNGRYPTIVTKGALAAYLMAEGFPSPLNQDLFEMYSVAWDPQMYTLLFERLGYRPDKTGTMSLLENAIRAGHLDGLRTMERNHPFVASILRGTGKEMEILLHVALERNSDAWSEVFNLLVTRLVGSPNQQASVDMIVRVINTKLQSDSIDEETLEDITLLERITEDELVDRERTRLISRLLAAVQVPAMRSWMTSNSLVPQQLYKALVRTMKSNAADPTQYLLTIEDLSRMSKHLEDTYLFVGGNNNNNNNNGNNNNNNNNSSSGMTKRFKFTKATHAHRRHVEGWLANEKLVNTLSREQVQDMHDFVQHVNQTQGPEPDRAALARNPEVVAAMMSNLSLDEAIKLANSLGLTIEQTILAHPEHFSERILATMAYRALVNNRPELAEQILRKYARQHPDTSGRFVRTKRGLLSEAISKGNATVVRLLLDDLDKDLAEDSSDSPAAVEYLQNLDGGLPSTALMTRNLDVLSAVLDSKAVQEAEFTSPELDGLDDETLELNVFKMNFEYIWNLSELKLWMEHPVFGLPKDIPPSDVEWLFTRAIQDNSFMDEIVPVLTFLKEFFYSGNQRPLVQLMPALARIPYFSLGRGALLRYMMSEGLERPAIDKWSNGHWDRDMYEIVLITLGYEPDEATSRQFLATATRRADVEFLRFLEEHVPHVRRAMNDANALGRVLQDAIMNIRRVEEKHMKFINYLVSRMKGLKEPFFAMYPFLGALRFMLRAHPMHTAASREISTLEDVPLATLRQRERNKKLEQVFSVLRLPAVQQWMKSFEPLVKELLQQLAQYVKDTTADPKSFLLTVEDLNKISKYVESFLPSNNNGNGDGNGGDANDNSKSKSKSDKSYNPTEGPMYRRTLVATSKHSRMPPLSAKTLSKSLREDMRMLWFEHVKWTRIVILSAYDDSRKAKHDENVARLLENQLHIASLVDAAISKSTNALARLAKNEETLNDAGWVTDAERDLLGFGLHQLLQTHITGAAAILDAAGKARLKTATGVAVMGTDPTADPREGALAQAPSDERLVPVADAISAWYANGDDLVRWLEPIAEPAGVTSAQLRDAIYTHLYQTIVEAVHELNEETDTSYRMYLKAQDHIRAVADVLTAALKHLRRPL